MRFAKAGFVVAVGLIVGLCAASPAGAATVTYSYVAGQSSFTVPAGGTVDVPLYLKEVSISASGEMVTSLLTEEGGLLGAGIGVQRQTGGAAANIIAIAAHSGFGGPATDSVAPDAASLLTGVAFLAPGVQPDESLTGGTATTTLTKYTRLGVVRIEGVTPGNATFSIGPNLSLGFAGGNTLTFANLYDLDVAPTGPATFPPATATAFTVSVVPEPSCVAGLLAAALSGGPRRRVRQSPRG